MNRNLATTYKKQKELNRCFKDYYFSTKVILFLTIFFTVATSETNFLKVENISIEHGLSQNTIFCILQDHNGFMWFGTEDGLNKYDGHKFVVYKKHSNDATTISENYILTMIEDKKANLWIGTEGGGLNKFDHKKDRFLNFENISDNINLATTRINSLCCDDLGNIWIGTGDLGLFKYNDTNKLFTHYKYNSDDFNSLSSNNVLSIIQDEAGFLWIGTNDGLNKFSPKTNIFTRYYSENSDPNSLSSNHILSLYEDNFGVLWIGTNGGGLNKFVLRETKVYGSKKNKFTHFKHEERNNISISGDIIYSICEDINGFLWIGTENGGLNKFDRKKNIFTSFKAIPGNPNTLITNRIYSLYYDRSNILWIGTKGGGLSKYDQEKKKFRHFKNHGDNSNSIGFNSVRALCEDRSGNLWIGTTGSLDLYKRKEKIFKHYKKIQYNNNSLSDDLIRSLCQDKFGDLWIGTEKGGVNKFNINTGVFTRYLHNPDNPSSLGFNNIRAILEDHLGNVWIGTYGGGLDCYDRKTNRFIHYVHDSDDPGSISFNKIYSLYEDKSGCLWIGTYGGGLCYFDRKNEKFVNFKHDPKNPNSLCHDNVFSILEDKSGILWIGTRGGLNSFDRKKQIFKVYNEAIGMSNETIYGLLEDDAEHLWLSTNKGLIKFDPVLETFKNFDISDGLQSNEFNGGAYYKGSDGTMYFGGINGFNEFNPTEIRDNPIIPPVVITDLQIYNKSVRIGEENNGNIVLNEAIYETKNIELSYKDNIISFEFAALHFAAPKQNQYAYKMENFDKDWNYCSDRRYATYTNLPSGKYVFKVKASNCDGLWNEEGTAVNVRIIPPYWETIWFRLISVIFILLIFSSVYKYRTRSIKKRTKLLEEKVLERTLKLRQANYELKKLSIVASETDNAISIMDAKGNFEWINDGFTRLHGYTFEEFVTEKGDNIFSASYFEGVKEIIETCLRDKKAMQYKSCITTKSKSEIWTQTTVTPIFEENGQVTKLVTIETNISELEQVRKEAEAATKVKSDFLSNMSHEIRTPMNGVIGMTGLLLDTDLTAEQREFVQTIKSSGDALMTIINDILDFSKVEAGKLNLEILNFNLRLALEKMTELLALQAHEKKIEFICIISPEIPSLLQGDPGRLRQILINLSSNAIKFTSKGEVSIHVSLESEDNSQVILRFDIKDTGIGISESKIEKLFNAFTQVDSSTTRKFGGTGLGLSISKRLAELMGGQIGVESEKGKGSTFWFTAKFKKQRLDYKNKEIDLQDIRDTRILVVDDNQTNRRMIMLLLKSWQCQYDEAPNAEIALKKLHNAEKDGHPFHIAILDMFMPKINGEMLGKEIKKDPVLSKTPLVLMTSVGRRGDVARLKEIGFSGYLTKPVKQSQLYDCLATVHSKDKFTTSLTKKQIVTRHSLAETKRQKVRILLAEDNPINQKVAFKILEKLGYYADIVADGREAIKSLESISYDIVLMDCQMPVMDGYEATRSIRNSESGVKNHHIPVIAMTAHAMKGDRKKCIEAGMNDYISKPVDSKVFEEMIKRWTVDR